MNNFLCPFGYDYFGEAVRTLSVDIFCIYLKKLASKCPSSWKKIGMFGDSHLRTFFCPEIDIYENHCIAPDIAYIPGASLVGFGRRKSYMGHLKKVISYCEIIKPECIFLKFGQVDIELGYWFRRIIKGENLYIENFIENLVDGYRYSIDRLSNMTNIFLCSINLPTIINTHLHANIVSKIIVNENIHENILKEVYIKYIDKYMYNYKIRTNFIYLFNKKIKYLQKSNVKFIDMTSIFTKKDKYFLDPEYLQTEDLHYKISSDKRILITKYILSNIQK